MLVKVPLNSVYRRFKSFNLQYFLKEHGILDLLENGAFIGGGFARQLALGNDLAKYFCVFDNHGYLTLSRRRGDIDIFFNSHEVYRRAVKMYAQQVNYEEYHDLLSQSIVKPIIASVNKSATGFCYDITARWKMSDIFSCPNLMQRTVTRAQRTSHNTPLDVKIQLVGEFIGDIDAVAASYDFTNVIAFLTKDGLLYHKDLLKLESKKLLDIKSNDSPLLAQRIHKYTSYRGLDRLTCRSTAHITKWLCRARAGEWEGHPLSKFLPNKNILTISQSYMPSLIRRPEIIQTSDLPILVGKYIENRTIRKSSRYMQGIYKDVDIVVEEYEKRKLTI